MCKNSGGNEASAGDSQGSLVGISGTVRGTVKANCRALESKKPELGSQICSYLLAV